MPLINRNAHPVNQKKNSRILFEFSWFRCLQVNAIRRVGHKKMAIFSVASPIQIGLLLVLICWTTGSTGTAFHLEEEFRQLKENYIQMKEVVKSLESKATLLESKVIQLESNEIQMKEKVTELEAKVEQQATLLTSLLRDKIERKAANDFDSARAEVAISGLPSSCGDLKTIGHTLNGFYSVMGSTRMESVYCDFTKLPDDADFQKWIGYTDVKSAPVYFHVQRNSSLSAFAKIPFDLALANEGNAMDLASGIFTAPRNGIYFFSFTGHARFLSSESYVSLGVFLYLNGHQIGTGYVTEASTLGEMWSPLTLQSTLNLKKGDQVWVQIVFMTLSSLFDNEYHYTHFTGFMLQEEIVASL